MQTLENTRTINVFIGDDSEIVRDRLTSMLTEVPSINIIGYADNPLAATESIVRSKPDVVTLDIFLTGTNEPNLTVDITATIDQKIAALKEHKSQIGDPEKLEERMREFGARSAEGTSFHYAERFRRVQLPG